MGESERKGTLRRTTLRRERTRQRKGHKRRSRKEAKSVGERSVCRCEVAVLQGPRGVFHFQPDKLDAIDRLDCAPPRNGYGMLWRYAYNVKSPVARDAKKY